MLNHETSSFGQYRKIAGRTYEFYQQVRGISTVESVKESAKEDGAIRVRKVKNSYDEIAIYAIFPPN